MPLTLHRRFPHLPLLALLCATALAAQTPTPETLPMTQATGTFDVKLLPTANAPDPSLSSYSINKTFHGGLEATTVGEMYSAGDPAKGSAGYVAIERVTGTLNGRTGTFAIIHMATMQPGVPPQMSITIVPGSGTGQLAGITGTFTIAIADGKHSYTLNYSLPAS